MKTLSDAQMLDANLAYIINVSLVVKSDVTRDGK